MKLMVFKLMYRLTSNRKWVIRYVNEMDKRILEDIRQWRLENDCNL